MKLRVFTILRTLDTLAPGRTEILSSVTTYLREAVAAKNIAQLRALVDISDAMVMHCDGSETHDRVALQGALSDARSIVAPIPVGTDEDPFPFDRNLGQVIRNWVDLSKSIDLPAEVSIDLYKEVSLTRALCVSHMHTDRLRALYQKHFLDFAYPPTPQGPKE